MKMCKNSVYCKNICCQGNRYECEHIETVNTFYHDQELEHISCPDQDHETESNVDLLFKYGDTYIEVEAKRIFVYPESINGKQLDNTNEQLVDIISKIIDDLGIVGRYYIRIEPSRATTNHTSDKIKSDLGNKLRMIDLSAQKLPFEIECKNLCRIVFEKFPEEFANYKEDIMFGIPTSLADPPTVERVRSAIFDVSDVAKEINKYQQSTKAKFRINGSKRVLLIIIEYTGVLKAFVNELHNEFMDEPVSPIDEISDNLTMKIDIDSFFDSVIVEFPDWETCCIKRAKSSKMLV